jgi:hypothetical protein
MVMNAKFIVAALLVFAAVPASFAEQYGRGSQSSEFAAKPIVNAGASVDSQGRASANLSVAVVQKSEVKARLAVAASTPSRA